jgi:hypothetical protein
MMTCHSGSNDRDQILLESSEKSSFKGSHCKYQITVWKSPARRYRQLDTIGRQQVRVQSSGLKVQGSRFRRRFRDIGFGDIGFGDVGFGNIWFGKREGQISPLDTLPNRSSPVTGSKLKSIGLKRWDLGIQGLGSLDYGFIVYGLWFGSLSLGSEV